MISIGLAVAVMVIGLCLFVFTTGDRSKEIGRLMFFAGLLVVLLGSRAATLHLN